MLVLTTSTTAEDRPDRVSASDNDRRPSYLRTSAPVENEGSKDNGECFPMGRYMHVVLIVKFVMVSSQKLDSVCPLSHVKHVVAQRSAGCTLLPELPVPSNRVVNDSPDFSDTYPAAVSPSIDETVAIAFPHILASHLVSHEGQQFRRLDEFIVSVSSGSDESQDMLRHGDRQQLRERCSIYGRKGKMATGLRWAIQQACQRVGSRSGQRKRTRLDHVSQHLEELPRLVDVLQYLHRADQVEFTALGMQLLRRRMSVTKSSNP